MFHIDFICACLLLIIVLIFNAYYRIHQVDKLGDKKGSANIYDLGFEIIPEISLDFEFTCMKEKLKHFMKY